MRGLGTWIVGAAACGALLAASALVGPAPAWAQGGGVHLDRYRPAPTLDDGWTLSRPDDRGHLQAGVRLDLGYALDPLVVEGTAGEPSTEEGALVEHQLVAHLGGSLGLFDRLVVFAGLPIDLVQSGASFEGLPEGDGAGLGDLVLGARARIVGEAADAFALGLSLALTVPSADLVDDTQSYTGEAGATVAPVLLAEVRPAHDVRLTGNLGLRLRTGDGARLANLALDHELTFAVGLTFQAVRDRLALYLEGFGSTVLDAIGNDGSREATPFEVLAGARVRATPEVDVGLALGPGLTRGYGSPDLRGVLTVGYTQRPPAAEAAVGDADGDGLLDDVDACPTEPEDPDGFEDENGCPDPDNDGDGVLDASDRCPLEPEDPDGFEDENGCPDPDNDGDGILDGSDACPLEREDMDGFEDADGCPDPDNDGDGVLDADDRCPNEAGVPENQGCPPVAQVQEGQIIVLDRIEFATDSDELLQPSHGVLQNVRQVLQDHPEITRVRVEGHTDDVNTDAYNMRLSRNRARTVVRWLVEQGIDTGRLVAFGCGEVHPVVENASDGDRQTNRRVEFHILQPAPPQGARTLPGCQRISHR